MEEHVSFPIDEELIYGIPTDGPYQTNLPPIEDIISSIRVDRDGQVRRIRHEEEIDVLEYQVLTHEIEPSLKPLEEIIRENVFCLGEVIIPLLPLLPSINHPHLISTMMMTMVVGKIYPKMNRMSVDDGDGVLDSQSDDGDGVLDSQTKDVIEEASMLPTMSSNSPQAGNAAVSEFFAEFDALKKEVLLIKQRKDDEFYELTKIFSKLETSETFVKFKKLLTNDLCTENESSDCNPKKSDGGVSIEEKPNFSSHHNDSSNHIGGVSSEAKVLNQIQHSPQKDKKGSAKSSLNDLELQQEPDIVDVKDGILEQQANADKGKTTVIQETVGVKVEEQPSLGRGLGTLKFKKKNCERALRPNYVLRSAKIRKKKMAMSLKSTPVPTKRKTRLNKTEDIVLPYDLEDISGQPRIRSINHIMTHDPFS
ncbi:hypothetical protein Tco_0529716 [Tanacetum coccineum]